MIKHNALFGASLAVTLLAVAPWTALAQTAPAPAAADTKTAADPAPGAASQTGAARVGGTYALDPHHTQVVFSYEHMGFSTSTGIVRGIEGTMTLDVEAPEKSTVEASFPLSAMLTISPVLDKDLGQKEFFNGAAPDTIVTYKSTKVEPKGADKATVTGDLTLNGVTKPVVLEVTLRQMAESPMTKKPAAGFEAHGTLKRSDFNLGAFAPAVSDEVQLTINAEGQKG